MAQDFVHQICAGPRYVNVASPRVALPSNPFHHNNALLNSNPASHTPLPSKMNFDDDGDDPPAAPVAERFCKSCKSLRPARLFLNKKGSYGLLCQTHAAEHAARTKENRQAEALRRREQGVINGDDFDAPGKFPPVKVTWEGFLALWVKATTTRDTCEWAITLGDDHNLLSLTVPKEFARCIANEVWEATTFRWIPKGVSKKGPNQSISTYRYHCSQSSQDAQPGVREPKRLKTRMIRYPCHGMLNVTVDPSNMKEIVVKYRHLRFHEPYVDVSIPQEAKNFINARKDKTPGQLFDDLQRSDEGQGLHFTQKQVHEYWTQINAATWCLDSKDETRSALMVLERHRVDNVEMVPLPAEQGVIAFAFVLKDVLSARGRSINELAMDSTWKTNKLGHELYAFVGEANGTALPFLYMFVHTDGAAIRGAKRRLLATCLRFIRPDCPNVKFILTDKDQSEIGAALDVYPEAKHQLCYWHVMRYLTERLSENKKPRKYDAEAAHDKFSFIDKHWNIDDEDEYDSDLSEQEDRPADDVEGAIRDAAERHRPNRVTTFCPPVHRKQLKEMHRYIMCMHSSIPSCFHDNDSLSPERIHAWATEEIYRYCKDNNLRLAWAYMWNQWYRPGQWELWARAAGNEIPRIRTTMMVESLWNTIKHKYLFDFNRPRLDLAIHLILLHSLPNIRVKLQKLAGTWRRGQRGVPLPDWQKAMKAQWTKSSKTPVAEIHREQNGEDEEEGEIEEPAAAVGFRVEWHDAVEPDGWITNLDRWVCSCPSFLLSRFLLCKHLISMVDMRLDFAPLKKAGFFAKLRRYHSAPFYRVEGIHQMLPDPTRPTPAPVIQPNLLSTQSRSMTTTVIPGANTGADQALGTDLDAGDDEIVEPSLANPFPNRERYTRRVAPTEPVEENRRYFNNARRDKLKKYFELILKEIGPEEYLHEKHVAVIEKALVGAEALGRSLDEDNTQRRLATTWREYNKYTAYRS